MRFPFLAAEYTNIVAFATFAKVAQLNFCRGKSSAALRAASAPRCGALRGHGALALRRHPGPLASAARGSLDCRLRGPPGLTGTPDACQAAAPRRLSLEPECVHIPTSCKHSGWVRSGSRGCPQSYPFLADARCGSVRTRIGLQDMYPVARGADRACTPHPVRLESDRRETRLRAALRSPIGAAYELVS